MPPEAMMERSSNWRNCMGMKTGWPHLVQGTLSKGTRVAGMKIFTRHEPHSTIFSGMRSAESAALTLASVTFGGVRTRGLRVGGGRFYRWRQAAGLCVILFVF